MKKQREIGKERTCDNEEGKLLDVDKKEIKKREEIKEGRKESGTEKI